MFLYLSEWGQAGRGAGWVRWEGEGGGGGSLHDAVACTPNISDTKVDFFLSKSARINV